MKNKFWVLFCNLFMSAKATLFYCLRLRGLIETLERVELQPAASRVLLRQLEENGLLDTPRPGLTPPQG